MGMYDILPGGQLIKCWWREMRKINIGDKVPEVDGERAYSIVLREGGYANVFNCRFVSITEKPGLVLILDKWGAPVADSEKIPDSYFLEKEK